MAISYSKLIGCFPHSTENCKVFKYFIEIPDILKSARTDFIETLRKAIEESIDRLYKNYVPPKNGSYDLMPAFITVFVSTIDPKLDSFYNRYRSEIEKTMKQIDESVWPNYKSLLINGWLTILGALPFAGGAVKTAISARIKGGITGGIKQGVTYVPRTIAAYFAKKRIPLEKAKAYATKYGETIGRLERGNKLIPKKKVLELAVKNANNYANHVASIVVPQAEKAARNSTVAAIAWLGAETAANAGDMVAKRFTLDSQEPENPFIVKQFSASQALDLKKDRDLAIAFVPLISSGISAWDAGRDWGAVHLNFPLNRLVMMYKMYLVMQPSDWADNKQILLNSLRNDLEKKTDLKRKLEIDSIPDNMPNKSAEESNKKEKAFDELKSCFFNLTKQNK